jgi:amino acid adenylation domain-containing protein
MLRDVDIIERFEACAAAAPEAVALVAGADRVSYRELDERANRLAHALRAKGIERETVVATCFGRTADAFVAMLAVLKTGGAFLPMDPVHPAERHEAMCAVADARMLLGAPLPEHDGFPATPPPRVVGERDVRCVIFTSGSTGQPKGIALTSEAIAKVADWATARTTAPEVWVQFTSLGFDVSLQEIFGALLSGGSLVLVSEDHRRDPVALLRLLAESGAQRLYLSPAFLRQLAGAAAAHPELTAAVRLTEVVSAGEQLRLTADIRRFFAVTGAVLENQCGPSETHQATAFTMVGDPARWPDPPPLGRPLPGVRAYLLDAALLPVADGTPGELYLAGAGVARGYVGRPDLTAERFLPDPFADEPGTRMYRTGDLARTLATGELEFLGRVDNQVKVRGHRVEPSEVDAVLGAHPDVRETVTVARQAPDGTWALVSYLVAAPGREVPHAAELRGFARSRLPEYMVPGALVPLAALPLNTNGKVDRAALPEPGAAHRNLTTPYVPPGNPQQTLIRDIWAEALGVDGVGVEDDFLELGGNSLQAMQIAARISQTFDVDVSVRVLFDAPTVGRLAEVVEELVIAELSS